MIDRKRSYCVSYVYKFFYTRGLQSKTVSLGSWHWEYQNGTAENEVEVEKSFYTNGDGSIRKVYSVRKNNSGRKVITVQFFTVTARGGLGKQIAYKTL